MGKRDKEHRKKVAKRNEQISQQRKSNEKLQREFIMDLINKEKMSGKFDNNPTLPPDVSGILGPTI
jgi:cell division protein FtsL